MQNKRGMDLGWGVSMVPCFDCEGVGDVIASAMYQFVDTSKRARRRSNAVPRSFE